MPKRSWATVKAEYEKAVQEYDTEQKKGGADGDVLKRLQKTRDSIKPVYDALKEVNDAEDEVKKAEDKKRSAQSGTDEGVKRDAELESSQAKNKLAKLKTAAAYVESAGSLRTMQEAELKAALIDIYQYENEKREADEKKDAQKASTAQVNLENAMSRWQIANQALQVVGTKDSVMSLEAGGIERMKIAISGHLTSLDGDINAAQVQLDSTGAGLANAPNAIMGVGNDKALIRANDNAAIRAGSASASLDGESADVWTKVAFTVRSQSDTSSTTESTISGSANVEVSGWWASVKASSTFSSSSKKVESAMSSCSVDGSFSAMVVNIKRPWLHGDLFQDFDIDISENTKLSPGAAQVKQWVENGDIGNGTNRRTEYGKFPAYPTAFIVAADTVLEVCNLSPGS